MDKIFKAIEGYEGLYEVSECGCVRSLDRYVNGSKSDKVFKKGVELSHAVNRKGYAFLKLSKNGIGKCVTVHKLVASTFLKRPDNATQVNHLDGDKLNNHYKNLKWCTQSENIRHAFDNGLNKGSMIGVFGENHPRSALTDAERDNLREDRLSGMLVKDCVKKYGVSARTVYRVAANG